MFYLRKSWVPRQCQKCQRATSVWRTSKRSISGSRLWMQSACILCCLEELYSDDIMAIATSGSQFFAGIPKNVDFDGKHYPIPMVIK